MSDGSVHYRCTNRNGDDSRFPPEMWAATPSDDLRTTNSVENFHSHYNWSFYHAHPHIHLVIDTMKSIQVSTDLKLNSVRRGRINPRGNDNKARRAALK